MKNNFLKFAINLAIILVGVLVMLFTSMLLEVAFIDALFVRQMVVYLVILLELYVTARIVYELNRNEDWMKSR